MDSVTVQCTVYSVQCTVQCTVYSVHPQRDAATFSNDLAIIKLAADVTFSERVKPICIGDLSHKITAGDQVHQLRHIYFLDPTGYQKLSVI